MIAIAPWVSHVSFSSSVASSSRSFGPISELLMKFTGISNVCTKPPSAKWAPVNGTCDQGAGNTQYWCVLSSERMSLMLTACDFHVLVSLCKLFAWKAFASLAWLCRDLKDRQESAPVHVVYLMRYLILIGYSRCITSLIYVFCDCTICFLPSPLLSLYSMKPCAAVLWMLIQTT